MGNMSGGQMLGSMLGFMLGGSMLASIGGYIGGLLDPSIPDAPELTDLDTNTYIRNAPVPVCIGTNKVYGGVIFIGENSVEMENTASKKNPSYEARYNADFAVAMSEGAISSFGKYLINDDEVDDAEEDSDIEFNTYEYLGNTTQLANSIISSFLSSETYGAIPFRNTAYVVCSGCLGSSNNLATIANYVSGLFLETDELDANPVNAIYQWLINKRWGMGIDSDCIGGSPTTAGSTWKIEYDFCNEQIPIYTGTSTTEPRFRFSKVYTSKMKGYDILSELLQICRGFLYISEGKLQIKIQKKNEIPVFYFGDGVTKIYTVNAISTNGKIYADFSNVPVDFHNGDLLYYIINEIKYKYVVIDQTSTYVDILPLDYDANLSEYFAPDVGLSFTIVKDNIKKGTFEYATKLISETYNKIRVEFINRLYDEEDASDTDVENEYRDDFVEQDDVYNINETNEIRMLTVTCEGIKKKTQANRLAIYLKDMYAYVNFSSAFSTDIIGYLLEIGDIVGISHTIPGWEIKLFRLVSVEETETMELKLSFTEYISSIFSDDSEQVEETTASTSIYGKYDVPDSVDRFHVVEDSKEPRVYFLIKKPDNNYSYWIGAEIYIKNEEIWEYALVVYKVTPSVKLNCAISDSDTTIYFDSTTMYGSFDASGSIWIENEEIYYSSIDDVNNCFLNCVRGYNNTTAMIHVITCYCYLVQNYSVYYNITEEDVGNLLEFKAISLSSFGIHSTIAQTDSITVVGNSLAPSSVSLLQLNSLGSGNTLNSDEDAVLTWYGVSNGINRGYGYSYGFEPYGLGELTGVYQFKIEVYKSSTNTLLREIFLDNNVFTYTYTNVMNLEDNTVFETNLTFKIFQVNENFIYSLASTIITNS